MHILYIWFSFISISEHLSLILCMGLLKILTSFYTSPLIITTINIYFTIILIISVLHLKL